VDAEVRREEFDIDENARVKDRSRR
jgi:hypothetical protein